MNISANHPCFGSHCQPGAGRIHLPVSPDCNIRCRFCARGVNSRRQWPGAAARVVSPEEALNILGRALLLCPELKVAGVAGPGDPLASGHALETLSRVHEAYPWLLTCLSTNGLALPASLAGLTGAAGIKTLTVTVNAVDSGILSQLCAGVFWQGQFWPGKTGSQLLLAAQQEGIEQARSLGLVIKVNMVLVPGVNADHAPAVAARVAAWGASFINIIPLLPAAEFAGLRPPSPKMLQRAQAQAERFLPIMRHCRRCRADACGIPGINDFAPQLYNDFKPLETFSHG
jgi:nitrogen fixation protein NifB